MIAATPVVLVSDLGQVLLPFETRRAWDALLPHVDLPEAELRSVVGAVLRETGFGAGLVTEEEFYGRVRDRTGLRLSHKEFAIAWSDMFWVDEAVLTLIREAPVEQRYLLSNTNAIHWSYIRQHFGRVLEVFDGLFVSHETGLEKPNRAFYELVIARSGRPAEAHLFIDDIAENVEGARAAGMDAVLHTGAAALLAELEARGLRERGVPVPAAPASAARRGGGGNGRADS